MPSKAIVPGSGIETDTASRSRKPGSSLKLNASVVVAVVARKSKLSRWYGLAAGLVRLIRGTPPKEAEKELGVLPSLAKSKKVEERSLQIYFW